MNFEEFVEKVVSGEIKFYQVEKYMNGDKKFVIEIRRKVFEKKFGIKFENIGYYLIDFNQVIGKNIENMIGVVQIFMGVVGLFKINGEYVKGEFYIFFVIIEGVFVVSVNCGCFVLIVVGGVKIILIDDKMMCVLFFKCFDVRRVREVVEWVKNNFDYFQEKVVLKVIRYGKLRGVRLFIVGNNFYLCFEFEIGDVMGMNMVMIVSEEIMKVIEEEFFDVKYFVFFGNFCVDKKFNVMNFINGRGKIVIVEVVIFWKIVEEKLKIMFEFIVEVNYCKNFVGLVQVGLYGFNVYFGNIVGVIFFVIGQDEVQIIEGLYGIIFVEVMLEGDFYISIIMLSFEIGIVGGGIRVFMQREVFLIMGVVGGGDLLGMNVKKFVEIVVGVVFVGEFFLLVVIVVKYLVKVYKEFGCQVFFFWFVFVFIILIILVFFFLKGLWESILMFLKQRSVKGVVNCKIYQKSESKKEDGLEKVVFSVKEG